MGAERNSSRSRTTASTTQFGCAFEKFSIPTLKPFHYKEVFQTTCYHRMQLIKHGIAASVLTQLAKSMRVSQDHLIASLGFPRTVIVRKIQRRQNLSVAQAERVIGLAKLIGQIEIMVATSEVSDFNAAQWLGDWLCHPLPALGNHQPEEYVDTLTGQEILSSLLSQMQSGA